MAMGLFDEAIDHAEPQARPRAEFLGGEERIEHLAEILRCDAGAAVGHGDRDIVAGFHLGMTVGIVQVERRIGRLDRQPAAIGHGVPGVQAQVEHGIFELGRIDQRMPDRRLFEHGERNVLAQGTPQQRLGVRQQGVNVDRHRLEDLLSRKGQQPMGERGPAFGGLLGHVGEVAQLLIVGQRPDHDVGVDRDDGQQIVEVVRDPTGQLTQRLEPFGLVQPFLHRRLRGDVAVDRQDGFGLTGFVADQGHMAVDDQRSAVVRRQVDHPAPFAVPEHPGGGILRQRAVDAEHLVDRAAQHLLGGEPVKPRRGRVPEGHAAGEIADHDRVGRLFQHLGLFGDAQFAGAQRVLCRPLLGDVLKIDRHALRRRIGVQAQQGAGRCERFLERDLATVDQDALECAAERAVGQGRKFIPDHLADQRAARALHLALRRGIEEGEAPVAIEREEGVGDALENLAREAQARRSFLLAEQRLAVMEQDVHHHRAGDMREAEDDQHPGERRGEDLHDARRQQAEDQQRRREQDPGQHPRRPPPVHDIVEGLERDEPEQRGEQRIAIGRAEDRVNRAGPEIGGEITRRSDGDRCQPAERQDRQHQQQGDREKQAGTHQPDAEAGNGPARHGEQQAEGRAGKGKPACRYEAEARPAHGRRRDRPGQGGGRRIGGGRDCFFHRNPKSIPRFYEYASNKYRLGVPNYFSVISCACV